jgi:hypothetical protein
MRDEEVGEAEFALQIAEEVDDLRADADVEGGDGLVEDEELGAEGEGAGDVDALALAAGEFVRITGHGGVVEADLAQEFLATRRRSARECFSWITSGSVTICSTRMRGLRAA